MLSVSLLAVNVEHVDKEGRVGTVVPGFGCKWKLEHMRM